MLHHSIARVYSLLFSIAFIGLLLIPLRTLALDPKLIEDNFYGRSNLIEWTANLRLRIGDRVFPKVLVGEDGWLIYTAENEIEGYQHTDLFPEPELVRIQQALDALAARYAEQGITLVVVVPPNKNTIYPKPVPSQIPVIGVESSLSQLVA